MRQWIAAIVLTVFAQVAHAQTQARPADMIDAGKAIPGLVIEMRYAGSENFVGRPIKGYDAPVCLLTQKATDALARAQAALKETGLGLKLFDCYRPVRAVADFAAWARDPADTKRKSDYYPDIDKKDLFKFGYIAEKSGHSRGSTIDVTLVDLKTGAELDMGSPYDRFDTISWPSDPRPNASQRAHRMALRAVLTAQGFDALKEEWWHFKLKGEPYPNTAFDFPVTK